MSPVSLVFHTEITVKFTSVCLYNNNNNYNKTLSNSCERLLLGTSIWAQKLEIEASDRNIKSDLIHYQAGNGLRHACGPVQSNLEPVTCILEINVKIVTLDYQCHQFLIISYWYWYSEYWTQTCAHNGNIHSIKLEVYAEKQSASFTTQPNLQHQQL